MDLYTLLARPGGDPLAMQLAADMRALVAGWRARDWIEQHAEEQGGVIFESTASLAPCRPCARFAVAVLRGHPADEAITLACDHMQEMRPLALAADALVARYAPAAAS